MCIISNLLSGKFPDYRRVIPTNADKIVSVDRDQFKQVLQRISVLSHERNRAVRLQLKSDELSISASNMQNERAEEILAVDYQGDEVVVGANVGYILDVLNHLPEGLLNIALTDEQTSFTLQSAEDKRCLYIVMPMRL